MFYCCQRSCLSSSLRQNLKTSITTTFRGRRQLIYDSKIKTKNSYKYQECYENVKTTFQNIFHLSFIQFSGMNDVYTHISLSLHRHHYHKLFDGLGSVVWFVSRVKSGTDL